MPHPSAPIAVITLAFAAGILLREVGVQPHFLYLILCAAVLGISHVKRWYYLFWIATSACFLILGTMRYMPPENTSTSSPNFHEITIAKPLNTNSFGHQYIIKTPSGEWVLLQTDLDKVFSIGDRFLVYGTLAPIAPPKNPIDFDFRTYMRRKGVSRKLSPVTPEFIPLSAAASPRRWAHNLQQRLTQQLQKTPLSTDSKALVMALILGNKTDLTEERITQYKRAGAMHLLAISGLHVGIVLMLLRFLAAPLKRIPYGGVLAAILPIVLLWCFALITGGSPSVVRAVTMFSFLQVGLALRRKNAGIQGVWVSCIVLLVAQPRLLFDVGFQLSYSAVFGIVWMMPHWQRLFAKTNRFVRYFTSLMGLGCIAQLSVLPLSLYYFHQFPMLFWVSNLVLVPFLGIILLAGIGCIFVSFFPSIYGDLNVMDSVFQGYQWLVEWIAQWETYFIEQIPFRGSDAVLLGAVVVLLFYFLQRPNKQKAVVLGVVSILLHGQFYLDWNSSPKAWVVHAYKNSMLVAVHENTLRVFTPNKTQKIVRVAEQFQQHYRLDSIEYKPLQHTYQNVLVVDRLEVYRGIETVETVLLRQSSKVHLEAFIDSIQPKLIIADGSNYPSFISRWEKTCSEKNIRFHATEKDGAYPLN
jgi:competence protein ComEC